MKKRAEPATERLACIILAAGRGKRMETDRLPKVCFPVVGIPAINRGIGAFRACGVETFVIVIGQDAQPVIDAVSAEFPGALFARQNRPLGTGDAMRAGFEPLRRLGFDGLVFSSMGDKVVQPEAIRELLDGFRKARADAALMVSRFPNADDRGRVFVNSRGEVEAVVEESVLRAAEISLEVAKLCDRRRPVHVAPLREKCLSVFGDPAGCERLLGRVWTALAGADAALIAPSELRKALPDQPGSIRIGERLLPARVVRRFSRQANEAMYLFRAEALARGISRLRKNPQGEIFFPDIVSILAHPSDGKPPARVAAVEAKDPDWLLGFNSPDQLLAVEEKIRNRAEGAQPIGRPLATLSRRLFKPARAWLELLERFPPAARRRFAAIYGADAAVIEERRRAWTRSLKLFCRAYGADRAAILARAPASVNLMGRHVDVVGGYINVTNVNREALIVAAPREDDLVRIARADAPREPRREFAIGREIASIGWDDWLTYIRTDRVREMIARARGEWEHIVRAAAVRMQQHFKSRRLRGMDMVACADIPLAAGLGASSAMLVAASDVFVALNDLEVTPHQFVLLCGEGEWYLGSRGTAASHAGMKLGRRGCVTRLRFFPFEVDRLAPFPQGCRVALLHAPRDVEPAAGSEARGRGIASMQVALALARDRHPHLAHLIEHVRDIHPARLGIPLKDLYALLLGVPMRATAAELQRLLSSEGRRRMDEAMSGHAGEGAMDLRDALCFGVAECARSERMAGLLEEPAMERIASLLRASHDAERVSRWDGISTPFRWAADDDLLRRRIEDLQSEDPDRVMAGQIERLPGRFGPGSAAIDRIVDVAQSVPGVVGAQLSGAGAGGCAMALAREEAIEPLRKALLSRRIADRLDVCSFAEGAGVVEI